MPDYLLPDVGEGLTEAEIVAWHVAVGDTVEINQVICEIETAKSIVELPSPYAGEVTALLAAVGDTVPVGEPIITIGAPVAGEQPEIDLSNPAASGGSEGESLVGRAKAERGPVRRPRRGSVSPSTLAGAATQMQVQGAFSPGGAQSQEVVSDDEPVVPASTPDVPPERVRALAKPPVRKLAKDLGVDLTRVDPSGPGGTVTRDDVLAHADSSPRTSSDVAATATDRDDVRSGGGGQGSETRVPVKGLGKAMADAMTSSAFTAPHVTEWITVDCTETVRLVERIRQRKEFAGLHVTPLLLLARACLLAMRRTPEINSTFDAEAGEVVLKSYVHLGLAVASPRGLVVPNVKDSDRMDLRSLATAVTELVETARAGRSQPADMAGGTFTITNVGVFGVDAGTPIINPGESAILAFGAVNRRPWVDEVTGEVVARDVTTLALSFDHRHVDGEKGSRFLADVAGVLRDPGAALLL